MVPHFEDGSYVSGRVAILMVSQLFKWSVRDWITC